MRTRPANAAGWRLLVAMFALIAFAFQSYLTQTHIHSLPAASKITGAPALDSGADKTAKADPRGPSRDKLPGNDDSAKCPLCQAMGYAGHFVTPSAAALLLPQAAISILPLAPVIFSSRETPSHIWQGRAPPRS